MDLEEKYPQAKTFLAADFNARIGKDYLSLRSVIGLDMKDVPLSLGLP